MIGENEEKGEGSNHLLTHTTHLITIIYDFYLKLNINQLIKL